MNPSERRAKNRKPISGVEVSEITTLENYNVVAHHAVIVDASPSGFMLQISRPDLNPDLQGNLNLDDLVGQNVAMFLPQMDLDLDGHIIRGTHVGKGEFEVAVEFSSTIPEYWRECLIDLLPNNEELEAFESPMN